MRRRRWSTRRRLWSPRRRRRLTAKPGIIATIRAAITPPCKTAQAAGAPFRPRPRRPHHRRPAGRPRRRPAGRPRRPATWSRQRPPAAAYPSAGAQANAEPAWRPLEHWAPHAPIPTRILVHLRGFQLLIGDLLLQREPAILLIGLLGADIEAIANGRVGIKVDCFAVALMAHELVRRQFFHLRLALRGIGRGEGEPGGRQHIFLVLHDLPLARAAAQRKPRGRQRTEQGARGEFSTLHGSPRIRCFRHGLRAFSLSRYCDGMKFLRSRPWRAGLRPAVTFCPAMRPPRPPYPSARITAR